MSNYKDNVMALLEAGWSIRKANICQNEVKFDIDDRISSKLIIGKDSVTLYLSSVVLEQSKTDNLLEYVESELNYFKEDVRRDSIDVEVHLDMEGQVVFREER